MANEWPRPVIMRVFGIPVAQGRGRAYTYRPKGAAPGTVRVGMYDPHTSRDWKRTVQAVAIETRKQEGASWPLTGPVMISFSFFMPRPKSLPKKIRDHIKRPDWKNLVAGTEDALKGIVWLDDSQVVFAVVDKRYATQENPPGVTIRVGRSLDEAVK